MIKNDNGFVCVNCGKTVEKLGVTSRNHCPYCLHSLHVDIIPGDRANTCKGVLKPIAVENNSKKGYVIVFKCTKCGAITRNKSAPDDDFDTLLAISKSHADMFWCRRILIYNNI